MSKKTQQVEKKTHGKLIAAIVIPVVIVLIGVLIYMNSDAFFRNTTAVTVKDTKFSIAEYNYFFQRTFNETYNGIVSTYGQQMADYMVNPQQPLSTQQYNADKTWAEYMDELTIMNLQNIVLLHDEGKAAGYVLTAEEEATLAERYTDPEVQAAQYKTDVATFLKAAYGRGVDQKTYEKCIELNFYAGMYARVKEASFEFTDADYQAEYAKDPAKYDQVTFRVVSFPFADGEPESKDNARARAEEFYAKELTRDNFDQTARDFVGKEDAKEDVTLKQYAYKDTTSADYADWLFDITRQPDEVTLIEGKINYYVLMFLDRISPDYDTVNVRHILVKPISGSTEDGFTDKDWEDALKSAEGLLEQWKNGDATEESFAELAKEKSEDGGSKANGGLYSNVTKGYMVASFNDWCFDETRAEGDTGIVKSDYGYHVMYYVGAGANNFELTVGSAVRSNAYSAWTNELTPSYPVSTSDFGMRYVK